MDGIVTQPGMFGDAGGGWDLIASASASGNVDTDAVTGGIDTTGANLIIFGLAYNSGTVADDVADSNGNTWTEIVARGNNGRRLHLYYCLDPTVGSGHTFTGASRYPSICVAAYSGAAASSVLDQFTSDLNFSPGSITPTVDGSLIATLCHYGNTNAASIDSGFTIVEEETYAAFASEGSGLATLAQGTAAAADPTWSGPQIFCSLIASFKPAS